MSISPRTRKILWARAANRCAICKHELVIDSTDVDREAIVGDECHIIDKKSDGPRADKTKTIEELDDYNNLIILCKIHHKLIDDQPQTYTVDILHKIKVDHEKWVADRLEQNQEQANDEPKLVIVTLPQISDAKDVVNIVSVADSLWSDYETPNNKIELAAIKEFFAEFEGISVLSNELEYLVEARFRVKEQLQNLISLGYYIYGKVTHGKMKTNTGIMHWKMGYIVIKNFDIPQIIIGHHPSISF